MLVAQLEHQFNTNPSFTLQRLWFYVHATLHKLSLVHMLTIELLSTPVADEEREEDEDDLTGPGAEGLRAVLGEMKESNGWLAGGPVKGGEVIFIIEERLERMNG